MLVPDVSARASQIRYSFTGAQLLLFGAILYPGGRTPERVRRHRGRARGPVQPILVREKQKIAGIWMNAEFRPLPLGAVLLCGRLVAAARATCSMSAPRRSTSSASTTSSSRRAAARFPKRSGASRPACSTCASARGLYAENPHGVEISERRALPRAHHHPEPGPGRHLHGRDLPDRPTAGCVAVATRDIADQQVRVRALRRARRAPPRAVLYGLAAVLLSLGLGWAAAAGLPPPLLSALSSSLILTARRLCPSRAR